ncbi:MAG: hypothetical protein KAI24_22015 [Planctomycetes bacterium]|nr:hypothetical protein [Planctomycetota bacterium]
MAAVAAASSTTAQFTCPDDSTLPGIASNVSGTTDKVLTISQEATAADKTFNILVERRHPNGTWEVIETVAFTDTNAPPVTIPPGCRASIQDTDAGTDTDDVVGAANLN